MLLTMAKLIAILMSREHLGTLHLTGKHVECKPSAVSTHLLLHNHDRNFNDFSIDFKQWNKKLQRIL